MSDPYNGTILPFLAGINADNEPVFEALEVEIVEQSPTIIRLQKSPLFARGYAAGDKLEVINPQAAQYKLMQRSGNLAIRVFRKQDFISLAQQLTPVMEMLGGRLDLKTDTALVYTIHVSIGFNAIEEKLNAAVQEYPGTVWYYGNVYDEQDGSTPLNWWNDPS